ncbi:MAG TPA: 5-oxoprolinase subunit PxpA [Vicinamibacteria bacterium]|nr:5-oxoprolinase subunit PxpA [Vicinamibacteria bacterium]
MRVDLNADLGEGFGAWAMGDDDAVLEVVTSANIACGFHAGDPRVMDRTVGLAVMRGVALGAHPGHFDLRGFGRRAIPAEAAEIETDVLYQVGALSAFAHAHGAGLAHVKPHGALYNQAAADHVVARAIARGVARAGRGLVLVGLAGSSAMRGAAEAEGLRFAAEAFADRRYEPDGSLRSRRHKDAVLHDPAAAAAQAVSIVREGQAFDLDGRPVRVHADTLCIHGDAPGAAEVARAVRRALEAAGVTVGALDR